VVSVLFVAAEALIGAGLVRFEWVASNVSEARVYVMAFHLVNTFLLLAAMTLAAWFAKKGPVEFRASPALAGPSVAALLAVLLVGASGAVTALGDTLVLGAGVSPEDSPLVARLVATRFYHPTAAVAAFLLVLGVVLWLRPRTSAPARSRGAAVVAVFGAQLLLGGVNVLLKAPVWIQVLHLAISDGLWILLVLMTLEALTGEAPLTDRAASAARGNADSPRPGLRAAREEART
jgi:heme A synthase